MLRNVNWLRVFGNFFILFVVLVIGFIYYVFMFVVNFKYIDVGEISEISIPRLAYLLYIHALFLLVIWSYIQTTITDPGRVPLHWGFHLDDMELKKRRYCLICHIFKPERCHHCSICNRCVLNMDHHCPWVNNCIGFYNRKFFLLLIFYGLISLISVFGGMIPEVIHSITDLWNDYHNFEHMRNIYILISMVGLIVLTFLLIFFVKYHIVLLCSNMTTIEDLEKKRSNVFVNYDIGTYYNFEQVFGKNPWLWWLPVFGDSGKPSGDGVTWDQRLINNPETQRQNQIPRTAEPKNDD